MTRATATLVQTMIRHLIGMLKALEDWAKTAVIKD